MRSMVGLQFAPVFLSNDTLMYTHVQTRHQFRILTEDTIFTRSVQYLREHSSLRQCRPMHGGPLTSTVYIGLYVRIS